MIFNKLDDNFSILLPNGEHADIRINHSKRASRLSLKIATQPFIHVVVTKPRFCSAHYVHQFLEQQKDWIMAHLPQKQPLTDGKTLLYRGTSYMIKLLPKDARSQVRIEGDCITISADHAIVADRLKRFLKQQAKIILPPRIEHYSELLEKEVSKITIADYQSQWGRCNSKREITLNWRLIMAPDTVSDYVAAHEAAHLIQMNHSDAFWQIVDDLIPERKKAQKWLKNNGLKLQSL